jgi:hypothetical protein
VLSQVFFVVTCVCSFLLLGVECFRGWVEFDANARAVFFVLRLLCFIHASFNHLRFFPDVFPEAAVVDVVVQLFIQLAW